MTWGVTASKSKPGMQQVKTVAGQLPVGKAVEREKLFSSKKAYICAGMMLVCGLLTIIGGICQEFAIYRLWGKFYGWSIWAGVLFTITGTCAVLACNKQSKPRLVSATAFSILTIITALVVIIFFGFCVAKAVKMHHRRMEMKEKHHETENFGEHSGEFGRLRESGEYERRHHRKPHHSGKPHHHEHHHHRHPWPRPTGHPWPRPTGHPWPRPTGHPRPRPTGHPWPRPTGHPWPRPTGHPWPRPTGHPRPRPTGHPWPRPTGHPRPRPTGHPWPRPTGHPWPRPTGRHWPRPTGRHWPSPTGHPWPRPTGHHWPNPTMPSGPNSPVKGCKFTHSWPAMMLFVASLVVITLVFIELVISVILSIVGVRSLKAAKYMYVPSQNYKILG